MSRYHCDLHVEDFGPDQLHRHAECAKRRHVSTLGATTDTRSAPEAPSLFDSVEGRRRRDVGMARADTAAPRPWKDYADDAIRHLARTHGGEFTSDDVWRILDEWEIPRPPEGRALGPRMVAARNAGIIEPTGRYRPTDQTKSHGSPAALYVRGENA